MKQKGSIEIITFNLVDNTEEQSYYHGLQVLDTFYKNYEGYYGMDIARVDDDRWTLVLRWASRELEKEASANMMKSDVTNPFKMLINPKTVKKHVYPWVDID